jgi:DNA-binding MarR family transcriptional regulator
MNQRRARSKPPGALLEALLRIQHVYLTRLDAALQARGLSTAKFGALRVLAQADEPLPLWELAERLDCVRSNITQLVDRLEADGLVQRLPDPEDRRSKRAAITGEGRRRFEEGLKAKLDVERELLASLSPHEAEQLAVALEKLGADKAGSSVSSPRA